jgi:hypothetical protein
MTRPINVSNPERLVAGLTYRALKGHCYAHQWLGVQSSKSTQPQ